MIIIDEYKSAIKNDSNVWSVMTSLLCFNGLSTFVGYLMPKQPL